MSAISLEQAQSQLQAWLAASLAVANAREVIYNINWWNAQVKRLQAGDGVRVRGVTAV